MSSSPAVQQKNGVHLEHDRNGHLNGEQDQGASFKGPIHSDSHSTPDADIPEHEIPVNPKASLIAGIRRDSFTNIGNRRRSSASNQPVVNLRKAQGYSKDNEMARNVGA